ncbi:hypothetical protein HOD75_02595 [archaeon]|jgi:hypothetical protein|nr:hypothetical protein [archaeon]MBT4241766.1 hypothetical protein [archaeon]MBT4418314.1 hypothetical protein [archaeon]
MKAILKSSIFGISLFLIIYFSVMFFGGERLFSEDNFLWAIIFSIPLMISSYFGFKELEHRKKGKTVLKMTLSSAISSLIIFILIWIYWFIQFNFTIPKGEQGVAMMLWPIALIVGPLWFAALGAILAGIILFFYRKK